MLEAAAHEQGRQVRRRMGAGVAEIAAVQDHRAVQQGLAVFLGGLQVGHQLGEQRHVHAVDLLELLELLGGAAVVRKAVVTVGGRVDVVDVEGRGVDAVQHQGDGARGVGLEAEAGHVVHQADLVHVLLGAARVERGRRGRHRARLALPLLGHLHALLELADAGEILVEAVAVARAHRAAELAGLAAHGVQDALAELETAFLRLHFGLGAAHEHLAEDLGGALFGRDHHAAGGPGKTAGAPRAIDAEGHRREAREVADALGHELVEGDRVAETAAARMRSRGQEAVVGRVTAVDVRMGDAGEDAEVVAMRLEQFEIRRRLIVLPLARREEVVRDEAEVIADAQHATGLGARRRGRREGRGHGVEHRQGQQHAGAGQEAATGDGALERDERSLGGTERGHRGRFTC